MWGGGGGGVGWGSGGGGFGGVTIFLFYFGREKIRPYTTFNFFVVLGGGHFFFFFFFFFFFCVFCVFSSFGFGLWLRPSRSSAHRRKRAVTNTCGPPHFAARQKRGPYGAWQSLCLSQPPLRTRKPRPAGTPAQMRCGGS